MSFSKLWRLVKARWWLLLLGAGLGLAGGMFLAEQQNQDVAPSFEARAEVTFETTESDGRDRDEATTELGGSLDLAQDANADVIASEEGVVLSDERSGALIFSGRGETARQAEGVAAAMRRSYLEAVVRGADTDTEARRLAIIEEAATILARVDELAPEEPEPPPVVEEEPVDPVEQARLDSLNSEVSSLTQQRSKLAVDLILAETGSDRVGTVEEIQTEMDLVTERLEELYVDLAALTEELGVTPERTIPAPQEQPEPDTPRQGEVPQVDDPGELESTWTVAALEARYAELEMEYESLFAGSPDAAGEWTLSSIETTDLTGRRLPPLWIGAFGAIAAIAVLLALLILRARLGGVVWVGSDLPTAFLAEVPASVPVFRLRRRVVMAKRRNLGVQRLRNLVVGLLDREGGDVPVIGFAGVDIDRRQVEELALMLADSVAAADRSVLYLDLDFTTPSELGGGGPTVAEMVAAGRSDPEAGRAFAKRSLSESAGAGSNPRVFASGTTFDDPSDVVLTGSFGRLMQVACQEFDVVIATVPGAGEPLTAALSQRLDWLIAVCAPGRSTRKKVTSLGADTSSTAAVLAGSVLVKGSRRRKAENSAPGFTRPRNRRPTRPETADDVKAPDGTTVGA